MSTMCIEDGFEHNIKRAIEAFFEDYEDPEEALKDFNEGDNDDFVNYLYDRACQYTDLQELAEKEKDKRL